MAVSGPVNDKGQIAVGAVLKNAGARARFSPLVQEQLRLKPGYAGAQVCGPRGDSGVWSASRYREPDSILVEAMAQGRLRNVGRPVFARYNSPLSLWFLRRDEVLIEVTSEPQ